MRFFRIFAENIFSMYHQRKATGRRTEFGNLSDKAIINGFRRGDASIIREYFYGYS